MKKLNTPISGLTLFLLFSFFVSCDKDDEATNSKIFVVESSISDTTEIEEEIGFKYIRFGGKNLRSNLKVKTSEYLGISLNGVTFGNELTYENVLTNNDTLLLFAKFMVPQEEIPNQPSTMTFQSSGAETVVIEF